MRSLSPAEQVRKLTEENLRLKQQNEALRRDVATLKRVEVRIDDARAEPAHETPHAVKMFLIGPKMERIDSIMARMLKQWNDVGEELQEFARFEAAGQAATRAARRTDSSQQKETFSRTDSQARKETACWTDSNNLTET